MSIPLIEFWGQGDAMTHGTAIVLALLSLACWYVILDKLLGYVRDRRIDERTLAAYWDAGGGAGAVAALRRRDRSGAYAGLARTALNAAQALKQATRPVAAADASSFVRQALAQSLLQAQARMERGLTFLASVGATAPFIGLFGTVWGIYHALVGLTGQTQVVLEKVAGPVGEALIMTAAGLFVAIPAVLAYNALVRANRLRLAQLEGFAHGLHAYLSAGIRPGARATAADEACASGEAGAVAV
ncbi:MAG: MotA/TolQ/ExbB proton channel family protein [Burkholderiales bacterium]|nr:MotA/TolQ/ExbB proton channel family protein [Burkholderiales bacterium]